jgi:glycosyltransferase involved in cell wall biosynthesis
MNLTNPGLIKVVHFVGDGDQRFQYEHVASKLPIRCIFHGFLSRDQLFKIFEEADFFLLPSTASEGFPKVVAEAANFGCVPVVSNISSIPQYVDDNCGFVWDTRNDFTNYLSQVLNSTPEALKVRAGKAHTMATHFTYTRYIDRINQEVLN